MKSSPLSAMRPLLSILALVTPIYSAAIPSSDTSPNPLSNRQVGLYSIGKPGNIARETEISLTRAGFTYGTDPAGLNVYYPGGPLGLIRSDADFAGLDVDVVAHLVSVTADTALATAAVAANGGLNSIEDYDVLYNGQWQLSIGSLAVPGMLQNYTQDLLFSMERLSSNPYSVSRLNPSSDTLPFTVDDSIVTNLTGSTLESLFTEGRLFYVDYSAQSEFTPVSGRYGAACSALFYIDPTTSDFLPLAIKTNVGADLIYTPLDEANDWLLAKMMFNENDLWFTAWYHFSSTHYVVGIALQAAIRCMSADHPVLAILQRVNLQAYAFQQAAALLLFSTGGFIDQFSAFSGADARTTTQQYYTESAGNFQSNYFATQFQARGIINSTYGPPLTHSPFVEDATVINDALETFMTSFVDSYYTSNSAITNDPELQCWATEAIPAKIPDFPTSIPDTETLIGMLTHIAFLISVQHHTLNTNDPVTTNGQLPFHPSALYSPIPTAKGVTDILPFLPPAGQAIGQINLLAMFARPEFVNTDKALVNMFNNASMLAFLNADTKQAAATFQSSMLAFAGEVGARTFDSEGLSQGMPFVWKALDPEIAPYYAAI